jgi:[CysO sulfur-carrier protein]-S-L-cysteine hydrolase
MQLLITRKIAKRICREMRRAGRQEIGGLLMGEHVSEGIFRIANISVQRSGGTHVSFTRDPAKHRAQLARFFTRTGQDYSRFNYLGEWHSHPSFEAVPSPTDLHTMQSIVDDPAVGVHFLMLLVTGFSTKGDMQVTAMAFRAGTPPVPILVSIESRNGVFLGCGPLGWICRFFRK